MGSQYRKYCNEVKEESIFYQFQDNTANVFKNRITKQRRKGLNPFASGQSTTVSYPENGGRTRYFLAEATLCFAIEIFHLIHYST